MKKLILHVWRSFQFARAGIVKTYKSEKMFRFYFVLTLLILLLAVLLGMSILRISFLLVCCVGILGFELMNTGVERAIDAMEVHNTVSEFSKDAAAGAVAMFAIGAIIAMVLVFLDFFFR
jgi:diacylglycerol kinase